LVAGFYLELFYIAGVAAFAVVYIILNIKRDYKRVHTVRRNIIVLIATGALVQVAGMLV